MNKSDLPIAKFLYSMSAAASQPEKFAAPPGAQVIDRKDTGLVGGFQALAVEFQFGSQKIAIVSYGDTAVLSSDILADHRLGLELIVNSRITDVSAAQRVIDHIDTSYNFLDSQINEALTFFRDVQSKTNAPVVVVGHSLGGFLANIVSAKFGVSSVTFEAPQVPRTVLSRFGIGQAGDASSVHFARPTDPIAGRWPNTPDVLGRRVQLDPFPDRTILPSGSFAGNVSYLLAQHKLENMLDVVTLHPSYADFMRGVAVTIGTQLEKGGPAPLPSDLTSAPPRPASAAEVVLKLISGDQAGRDQSGASGSSQSAPQPPRSEPPSPSPSPSTPSATSSGSVPSDIRGPLSNLRSDGSRDSANTPPAAPVKSDEVGNNGSGGTAGGNGNGDGNSNGNLNGGAGGNEGGQHAADGSGAGKPNGSGDGTGSGKDSGSGEPGAVFQAHDDGKVTLEHAGEPTSVESGTDNGSKTGSEGGSHPNNDGSSDNGSKKDNNGETKSSDNDDGFYTEDQWNARHLAKLEAEEQSAFEIWFHENPPNVDPRQGQDEEELARKYEQKLNAWFSANAPKPDVDPYPPGFTDSLAPSHEIDSRIKLPAPNVDPLPPDVQPEKPASPPSSPGREVISTTLPADGTSRQGVSSLSPSSPQARKDTSPQFDNRTGWGSGGQPRVVDEPALYCSFDFNQFDAFTSGLARIQLIIRGTIPADEQASAWNAARKDLEGKVADIIKAAGRIELASNDYLDPASGTVTLQNSANLRTKQITIFEQTWGLSMNAKDGSADTTLKDIGGESNLVVGLNSFSTNRYVISVLPDYEALGGGLGEQLNAFKASKVIFLLPNKDEAIPATARIIIGAAKAKIKSSVSQVADSDLSKATGQTGPFERVALVYLRRSGTDRSGRKILDLDAAQVPDLLNATGGDRFLFVSLNPDGYIITGKESGTLRQMKGGADAGLSYWADPIRSILAQFVKDGRSSGVLPIKKLDNRSSATLSDLVRTKDDRRERSNICFVHIAH
ncbi:hypothetical protein [Bradyrhizobium sp. CCBAU 53338]|uniref:hypothetical protein n=1 Tax=Bradyrhizobium sp. CCBAU 53338 TaxID=1325111 RepID=UPI00188AE922|nr:hypothetical protein [Bradyrhizobium sp. CCBAU 53338]